MESGITVGLCLVMGWIAEIDGHSFGLWAGITAVLAIAGIFLIPIPFVGLIATFYTVPLLLFVCNLIRPAV